MAEVDDIFTFIKGSGADVAERQTAYSVGAEGELQSSIVWPISEKGVKLRLLWQVDFKTDGSARAYEVYSNDDGIPEAVRPLEVEELVLFAGIAMNDLTEDLGRSAAEALIEYTRKTLSENNPDQATS